MAKTILIFLIIGLITGFVANFIFGQNENNFSKVQTGGKEWSIEVVSSLNDRAKGLSNRESLSPNTGMLFIFPKEDRHGIWMKEMNFSIDIIWINEDLKVVDIEKEATPESFPEAFRPRAPALYVLEVNAGEAEEAGIKIGDSAKIF